MLKNKSISRNWITVNVILLTVLVIGIGAVNAYVSYINEPGIVYKSGDESEDIVVEVSETKRWSEKAHGYRYGVQYDVVMENLSSTELCNWYVEIQLPPNCAVDSSWNGEFVLTEQGLVVTPASYNKTIASGNKRDFGFVLYTDYEDNISTYTVNVHRHLHFWEMPLFWVFVLVLFVQVVVNITALFFWRKTARLRAQKQQYVDIVNESFLTFAKMIDAKDPYTQGHSHRVAIYTRELARRMGKTEEEQRQAFYVALLHDIGKIGVPDAVLKKTGKLSPDERATIEEHVQVGGDILKDFSAIEGIEAGARYHHERYDGTGYVSNWSGKDIPELARMICVADAFDAMTSMRCYRPKLPMHVVISELKECAGTQFDPDIVPYMLNMIEDGVVPVSVQGTDLQSALSIASINGGLHAKSKSLY
ncbi:MAG: HD domain-containing protein [Eubacterium sp.]|nr:HD domain-containing protein [Eubacterium sp.]